MPLTIFSFAPLVTLLSSMQSGTVNAVPSDGSAEVAVTFPQGFPNSVSQVVISIYNPSGSGVNELTAQVDSKTVNGFNLYVAGGPAGSTVTVDWIALGS